MQKTIFEIAQKKSHEKNTSTPSNHPACHLRCILGWQMPLRMFHNVPFPYDLLLTRSDSKPLWFVPASLNLRSNNFKNCSLVLFNQICPGQRQRKRFSLISHLPLPYDPGVGMNLFVCLAVKCTKPPWFTRIVGEKQLALKTHSPERENVQLNILNIYIMYYIFIYLLYILIYTIYILKIQLKTHSTKYMRAVHATLHHSGSECTSSK